MFIKVHKCDVMAGDIAQLGEIWSICLPAGTTTSTSLGWKITLALGAIPAGCHAPQNPAWVGGTYLIMCVIEKDATAVKEHTHASRKSRGCGRNQAVTIMRHMSAKCPGCPGCPTAISQPKSMRVCACLLGACLCIRKTLANASGRQSPCGYRKSQKGPRIQDSNSKEHLPAPKRTLHKYNFGFSSCIMSFNEP